MRSKIRKEVLAAEIYKPKLMYLSLALFLMKGLESFDYTKTLILCSDVSSIVLSKLKIRSEEKLYKFSFFFN